MRIILAVIGFETLTPNFQVFAVRDGSVDIHGCPLDKTWTTLGQTVDAGSDTIVLKEPVYNTSSLMTSWKVGDEVVIATTSGSNTVKHNERKTITAIADDGITITLNETLNHRHLSEIRTFGGTEIHFAAEVGNINRNIKFHGNINKEWYQELEPCDEEFRPEGIQNCFQNPFDDEVGHDQFGAHFIMHKITGARISYMEMTETGQMGGLGRYTIHWHLSMKQPD